MFYQPAQSCHTQNYCKEIRVDSTEKGRLYWNLCAMGTFKDHLPPSNLLEVLSKPDGRFRYIHLNVVRSLTPLQDFKYCLTLIDRFPKLPKAIPMAEQTVDSVTKAV